MKALSPKATEIFIKLIQLATANNDHIKINNNSAFMPVSIEKLDTFLFGEHKAVNVSIAHYGELNGDLMADPEMTFIFLPDLQKVYPSSFTNHYAGVYRESIFLENGIWKHLKTEQEDEALFADDWMLNIRQQQEI